VVETEMRQVKGQIGHEQQHDECRHRQVAQVARPDQRRCNGNDDGGEKREVNDRGERRRCAEPRRHGDSPAQPDDHQQHETRTGIRLLPGPARDGRQQESRQRCGDEAEDHLVRVPFEWCKPTHWPGDAVQPGQPHGHRDDRVHAGEQKERPKSVGEKRERAATV